MNTLKIYYELVRYHTLLSFYELSIGKNILIYVRKNILDDEQDYRIICSMTIFSRS